MASDGSWPLGMVPGLYPWNPGCCISMAWLCGDIFRKSRCFKASWLVPIGLMVADCGELAMSWVI